MSCNDTQRAAPVVIAGGGAVGITLALLLAEHGVASTVLERRPEPLDLPRAHAVNPRSLEVLRELSIGADELVPIAAPAELTSEVRFVTTMTGHCFGALDYERQGEAIGDLAAVGTLNVPQPALEAVLFAAAARQPLIELRRGHEWVDARHTEDGVRCTVRTADGDYRIGAEFLVAADGAGSTVRESLGIGMSGLADIGSAVSMTFSADLTEVVRDRPGVLHLVFAPPLNGILLCYQPDRLWTYIVGLPPGRVDMTEFTTERALELIRAALGPDAGDVVVEVVAVTPWTVHAQVAERYRVGRILLAGDAAHRFPPTGGLGLNTGLQDAHNLAWKLAGVLNGWAPDSLLDTYQAERQPIARRNAEQSAANLEATGALSVLVEAAHADDVAGFAADHRDQIGVALQRQRPHFDSVALQLGYSYDRRAEPIVDVTDFRPRALPGVRLPHGWLQVNGTRCAVHDLIDHRRFTVLLLDAGARPPVIDGDVPVAVLRIDRHAADAAEWLARIGLSRAAAVLVRPDGHILDVADRPDDTARFGDAIAALFHPSIEKEASHARHVS